MLSWVNWFNATILHFRLYLWMWIRSWTFTKTPIFDPPPFIVSPQKSSYCCFMPSSYVDLFFVSVRIVDFWQQRKVRSSTRSLSEMFEKCLRQDNGFGDHITAKMFYFILLCLQPLQTWSLETSLLIMTNILSQSCVVFLRDVSACTMQLRELFYMHYTKTKAHEP